MTTMRTLQRLASERPKRDRVDRCELCSIALGDPHRHVVDLEQRSLCCACGACAILFVTGERFRTIPERVLAESNFELTQAEWTALGIPVGLAFVFASSRRGGHVVCYPGPAGITEAESDPGMWEALSRGTRLAAELVPDVEALLVYGARGTNHLDCFLIPIDVAYGLAGRLRGTWVGFSGGDVAQRELDGFLADLGRRSRRR